MTVNKQQLSLAHVLVVGDVMLDRYWYGAVDRISPEAPVPVVRITREENRLGGCANVAYNVVSLGGKASLLSVVGDDEATDEVRRGVEHLAERDRLLGLARRDRVRDLRDLRLRRVNLFLPGLPRRRLVVLDRASVGDRVGEIDREKREFVIREREDDSRPLYRALAGGGDWGFVRGVFHFFVPFCRFSGGLRACECPEIDPPPASTDRSTDEAIDRVA